MFVQKRGADNVSIYNLTAGPLLPEWISERARRNLSKKDESIRRRIELIQDFEMPASSSKLRQSRDGRYLLAAGTYPPRIRCYDTNELGLKFERYVTSGIVDVCMLGDDYGKFCLLQDDRTLAFHAPYGAHDSVRIPTFGRALAYESSTCDLLVAAKGSSVYRINLEEGRFQVPWELDVASSSNSQDGVVSSTCLSVHPVHPLTLAGCDDGILRFWDSRVADQFKPFLRLDVSSALLASNTQSYAINPHHSNEITAIAHDTGLNMAVGTATGMVALYDMRSSRPLHVYAHKAGQPVHTLHFHHDSSSSSSSDRGSCHVLLSADETLIQATSTTNSRRKNPTNNRSNTTSTANTTTLGSTLFHIEATSRFSHFLVADADNNNNNSSSSSSSSGLILCATDQPKMEAFYVPSLGVAPKWCSFLENITEELHERDHTTSSSGAMNTTNAISSEETVFENYKFVSRDDVDTLGLAHLIGTPLLRGYMHGFFMDQNLYHRVKAIANPFEFEEYQKKKLAERVQAKRASRIAPRDSKNKTTAAAVKVNPDLAERLQAKANISSGNKNKKSGAEDILHDDRFGSLFTNPDFEIDEDDHNFKLRNPSGVAAVRRRKENMDSDEDDDNGDDIDDEFDESELAASLRKAGRGKEGENDEPASDGDGGGDDDNDESSDDDDDSDHIEFKGVKVRGEEYETVKAAFKRKHPPSSSKSKGNNNKVRGNDRIEKKKNKSVKRVKMYEAEDTSNAVGLGLGNQEASQRVRRRLDEMNLPLAKRIAQQQQDLRDKQHPTLQVRNVQHQGGGSKEAMYIPRDVQKKLEQEERRQQDEQRGRRKRRGVKELGLKTIR